MKSLIIVIFCSIVLMNCKSVHAQEINFGSLGKFINTKGSEKKKEDKYSFISQPKDLNNKGNFRVDCYVDGVSGTKRSIFDGLQIKSYQIQVTNYIVTMNNDKKALIPINSCYIIEN